MAQVTTGPTKEKTLHLARDLAISVAVLIAVAAFFAGWALGRNHPKSQAASSSSMLTYKNQENGFQLQYPSDWGTPNFNKTDINGNTSYMLSFYKQPHGELKYSINLTMLKGPHALTDSNVKTILKDNKSALTVSDDTSYAAVANAPKLKISSLNDVQIVNLTKIGVTAAAMTYQINGGTVSCPQNKLATNSNGACVEKGDYDTVNTVMKSLKSI